MTQRISWGFLLVSIALVAQPTLTLQKATGAITPGQTFTANVVLSGSSGTSDADYQFDFTVPAGVTLSKPAASGSATGASKTLTCTSSVNRCVVAGVNQNQIADGVLATVTVTLPATLSVGPVLALANSIGATVAGGSLTATVGVPPLSYVPCDLDGSGTVDTQDVSLMLGQVLGQTACSNDLTGDGMCTVVDLRRIENASVPGGACVVGP